MSAPKTDLEKQERQHRVPLTGMAWMVVFAAVLLVALVIYLSVSGNEPGDETPIESETATGSDDSSAGDVTGESQ